MWGLIQPLLGRERAWRLGRGLYMRARGEVGNAIATNGEAALARQVAAAHRNRASGDPLRIYDIGANLGDYTAAALDAAGDAPVRIELFEPVPTAHARVAARFAGDDRVVANQLAISNRDGEAEMIVVGEASGTNSLNAAPGTTGSTVTVPLRTLERHLDATGAATVYLVKIDAEGHDIEILRAIGPLLAARRLGVVQFEYNWRWLINRGSLFEVFQLIAATDYVLARVADPVPLAIDGWNAELDRYFEANYALIRSDLVDPLGARRMRWDGSNVLVAA